MRQLFIDLDGVLADFDGAYFTHFGWRINRVHGDAADPPNFWPNILSHGRFYADLPMLPDALDLWAGVQRLHPNPIILTGIPHSISDAEAHKREWVATHIGPDVQVICCASKDKCLHGQPGDILVDDWPRWKHYWLDMGGIFVQHTSAKTSLHEIVVLQAADAFNGHLDACDQCRLRPFDLCPEGVGFMRQLQEVVK